jgi:serine protease Do
LASLYYCLNLNGSKTIAFCFPDADGMYMLDSPATPADQDPKGRTRKSRRRFPVSPRTGAGVLTALALLAFAGAEASESRNPPAKPERRVEVAPAPVLPSFSALVERVAPAVVCVRVKANPNLITAHEEGGDNQEADKDNPFDGTPLQRFFGPKDGLAPHKRDGGSEKPGEPFKPVQGQGSGFFISPDGYIVTNNHVVEGAIKVEVLTDTGEIFEAKVIGTDPGTDLALLKVDAARTFPTVSLGRAEAKVGDWVIALGNPFGLEGTVTAGIVSAQGRDIGMGSYDNFIQIDAPVNRGNSGGPTFNQAGEVIGVNTAIFSPTGGSVGIAFAIPARTVENVVAQLKDKGHVTRGWLGVQVQPVTPELADGLGLKPARGALVSIPAPGGPADEAGIKRGDVILKIDGGDVKDSRDLARKIAAITPESRIKIVIFRDDKRETVEVKLAELQDDKSAPPPGKGAVPQTEISSLGLSVAPAAEGPGGTAGLAIVELRPDGKAADAGLIKGDILLTANGTDLSSPDGLEAALHAAKTAGKKHALALVQRGGTQVYVALSTDLG